MNISTPTLLIDEAKCRANIEKMVLKAEKANATLRPHFKTHQSATIASWYREAGVNQCTVSSVSMAKYFVENGWDDITIAFPYNPLEADVISALAEKAHLNILLESEESQTHALENLTQNVGFFIKIDVGTHRTGLDHRNESAISDLIAKSSPKLEFKGFLAHAGHTYGAVGDKNIRWLFDGVVKMLLPLRDTFGGIISYGETPSCSIMDDLSMFDELRPGNFVFYDFMQAKIGSCSLEDIAVCMAVPVVAKHAQRGELVVYGGGVHLSKDSVGAEQEKSFGQAVELHPKGWNTTVLGNVTRLSQEHGIVHLPKNLLDEIKIGDLIGIIPVHSCLAADLQGHYYSTNGDKIDKISKG